MLNRIIFKNIGQFKDYTCIEIGPPEDAPSKQPGGSQGNSAESDKFYGSCAVFVGENGSGKSSVFEIIRRCLSDEITKSESKIPDKEECSFALCRFTLTPKNFRPHTSLNDISRVVGSMPKYKNIDKLKKFYQNLETYENITAYIGILREQNLGVKFKYLLFKYLDREESIMFIERQLAPELEEHFIDCSAASSMMETVDEKFDLENLRINLKQKCQDEQYSNGSCRDKIQYIVKKTYGLLFGKTGAVQVSFAHRGIGPLDSSLSPKMARGSLNYEDTVAGAEFLCQMLNVIVTKPELEKKYKRLVKMLLGHERYEIVRVDEKKMIFRDQETGVELDLLKIPEGVYEAHAFCLMLTDTSMARTLCLDEPNRCMHPTMVERMREIILQETSERKISVLLTTHSPSFVSPDLWKNTYKFTRKGDGYLSCRPLDDEYFIRNRISSEQLREILFSNTILFVEGMRDVLLIQRYISELMLNDFRDTTTEGGSSEYCHLGKMKVISAGGTDNAFLPISFCQDLNIPYLVLLDGDNKDKKKKEGLRLKRKVSTLRWRFLLKWISCRDLIPKTEKPATEPINALIQKMLDDPGFNFNKGKQEILTILEKKWHSESWFKKFKRAGDLMKCSDTEPYKNLFLWQTNLEDAINHSHTELDVEKDTKKDILRMNIYERSKLARLLIQSSEGEFTDFKEFLYDALRRME